MPLKLVFSAASFLLPWFLRPTKAEYAASTVLGFPGAAVTITMARLRR